MISQNWGEKKNKRAITHVLLLKFRKHEIYLQQVSGEKIVYLVKSNLPGTHNNFCLTFSTFWMCLLQQTLVNFSSSFCNNTRWLGEITSISTKKRESQSKISYLFIIWIVKFINILENAVGDQKNLEI